MSLDALERVAALCPELPVDADGLSLALAAFERGLVDEPATSITARRPAATRRLPGAVHWRRLTLAGVAAVAVTAAAIVLPARLAPSDTSTPQRLGGGLLPAAAAADPACATAAVAEPPAPVTIPRGKWATTPVADVLSLVGDRAPQHISAYKMLHRCPTAVPVAVVYDARNVRGVNVYRDVAASDITQIEKVGDAHEAAVRGVNGWILAWVNEGNYPRQRLTWIDASGQRWYAEAESLPEAQTVALLDGLTFGSDGVLDPASVPPGFAAAPATPSAPAGAPTYTWTAEYGTPKGEPGPGYVYLEVSTPATLPVETEVADFRNRLVDFDGVMAAYSPQGQGGSELRWVTNGVRYRLVAAVGSLDELLAVARTVRHATPADPLLQ
ncbi:MAG: hypothetical protein FWF90_13320 [Promicromonosporaceae bacterium]|nr:hypothetical protein [Promicromonosporaceae bacterium]